MHDIKTQIIVESPQKRGGIYVIVNIIKKKAYIGETIDMYRRIPEHICSLLGDGDNSNSNLKEEKYKAFEIFQALVNDYDKTISSLSNPTWIIHETIYMYLFRKYGFNLYNGNDNRIDNTGKSREFILKEELDGESLYSGLMEFLQKEGNNLHGGKIWEDFVEDADKKLNNDISTRFKKTLSEISKLDGNERIRLWNARVKEIKKNKEYNPYDVLENNNYKKVCDRLFSERLSITEMQQCGLKEKKVEDIIQLINDCKFNRIVVSKFGHYLDQVPMTILTTKVHDIENNCLKDLAGLINDKNNEKNNTGICFWALRRLPVDETKDYLSLNEEYKGPRYALLSYTSSKNYAFNKENKDDFQRLNPQYGESNKDFFNRIKGLEVENEELVQEKFAFGYALTKRDIKNKTGIRFSYPERMFPEIISKSEINSALLISELNYLKADFKEPKRIYEFFSSRTSDELTYTLKGANSHSCAELKDKEKLIAYLQDSSNQSGNNKVSFLIAKLEYPYIVALANNRIK